MVVYNLDLGGIPVPPGDAGIHLVVGYDETRPGAEADVTIHC